MRRSTNEIITSHVGSLPRPWVDSSQKRMTPLIRDTELTEAVGTVVKRQIEAGIAIPNDGEFGKVNFIQYFCDRFTGMERRPASAVKDPPTNALGRRDIAEFPSYFGDRGGVFPAGIPVVVCTGEIRFRGHEAVQADIANLKHAMQKHGAKEGFLTAVSPGSIHLTMPNEHYNTEESYLEAIADALHDEYKAITDAGIVLQIDDPALSNAWQKDTHWTVEDFRRHAAQQIEVLNHALRDCPPDLVRLHVCWGSYHGPHATDLEIKHFLDLLYTINAECYSIEGANPRHEHEWSVFETIKLPEGRSIMPGVVSHVSDTIEHPELVAQRLVRYATVVGRENVIAGTDCGLGRVHPEICWAKLKTLAEGAELASKMLWAA